MTKKTSTNFIETSAKGTIYSKKVQMCFNCEKKRKIIYNYCIIP